MKSSFAAHKVHIKQDYSVLRLSSASAEIGQKFIILSVAISEEHGPRQIWSVNSQCSTVWQFVWGHAASVRSLEFISSTSRLTCALRAREIVSF